MKKLFALILSAAVALTVFTGCGGPKEPTGPLRICVDIDFHLYTFPPDDTEGYAKYLADMVTSHGGPEDIELEIIPGEGVERETALTRIRTEIMGGGGPDVFLCSCVDTSIFGSEEKPLFQFPEKAMADGLFLPLDKYIETAQYMEWDKMQPALTAAGRTDEGQMIIPFSFSMPVTVYDEAETELPSADTTFDDVINGDPILKSTAKGLWNYDSWQRNSFPFLFTKLADYETGELAFTEDELCQRVTEALTLKKQSVKGLPRHFSDQLTPFTYSVQYSSDPELDPRQNIYASTEQVMLPLYNTDGGATALICSFGAVNANTSQPENAFLVLDTLLSRIMHRSCRLFSNFFYNAMPVRTDMGKENKVDSNHPTSEERFYYATAASDPMNEIAFNAFSNAREQISYARFNTVFDQELSKLITDFAIQRLRGDEETIREQVSKTYTKMKMLLAES